MRMQQAPQLEGWDSQKDECGFFIYTHPDFDGCIRLNPVDGTAEVFMDKTPLEDPGVGPAVFCEPGHATDIVEPSLEPLMRAQLCAEILIDAE